MPTNDDLTEFDPAAEWLNAQERVIGLVEGSDGEMMSRRVPACPDWTVRDLLAHMIGLDVDTLAGNEPDDHNGAWTQQQVDARTGRDVLALIEEWRGLSGPILRYMRETDPRPLGDVIIHEQDLRSALSIEGARSTPGFAAIRDRMAGRFREGVQAARLAPVVLEGGLWTFTTGDGDPGVRLEAEPFDLARALSSRRTAAQLRAWTVEGDVAPYLDLFASLGPLPAEPLPE